MADLIVTFGRASGDPPVMYGSGRRTEVLAIAASATDPVVTAMSSDDSPGHRSENVVDLYAGADCWVEIGVDPVAAVPDAPPANKSFFMKSGDRHQAYLRSGEKVSVVAAA